MEQRRDFCEAVNDKSFSLSSYKPDFPSFCPASGWDLASGCLLGLLSMGTAQWGHTRVQHGAGMSKATKQDAHSKSPGIGAKSWTQKITKSGSKATRF